MWTASVDDPLNKSMRVLFGKVLDKNDELIGWFVHGRNMTNGPFVGVSFVMLYVGCSILCYLSQLD